MTAASERTIIVAYNGSPASRQAVCEVARLLLPGHVVIATVWDAELVSMASMPSPDAAGLSPVMAPALDPVAADELERVVKRHATEIADDGAALAASLGLDAEPLVLADAGDIAGPLVELAERRAAVAIVVGSRGLHGMWARLEGSTSRRIVAHAPCPVLVVHNGGRR